MNITAKSMVLMLATAASVAFAEVPSVERVLVRQQWPWSRTVVIEYALAGGSEAVDIGVRAWNGGTEIDAARFRAALQGDLYAIMGTEGVHRLTFDPVEVFGTAQTAIKDFKVEVTATASAVYNPDEVLYKIVDLATGGIEDVRRVDFYNKRATYGTFETDYTVFGADFSTTEEHVLVWTGVTNDVKYATTHLVLRKIPAGTFTMGSATTDAAYKENQLRHEVTLTKDFWIGVFPVTQRQNSLLGAPANYYFTNELYAATRPADSIRYKEDLRGQTVVNDIDKVTGDVVFSRLRTLTGNVASFDLPTEAQWEYACRAGDSGPFYGGLTGCTGANIAKIGRAKYNGGGQQLDRNVDATHGTSPVGRYVPNPWGIYDMIGNVWEMCRDTLSGGCPTVSEAQTNPIVRLANGTSTQVPRRGACWDNTQGLVEGNYRSGFRSVANYMNDSVPLPAIQTGYRISFTEK